jgi:hypothetical protein
MRLLGILVSALWPPNCIHMHWSNALLRCQGCGSSLKSITKSWRQMLDARPAWKGAAPWVAFHVQGSDGIKGDLEGTFRSAQVEVPRKVSRIEAIAKKDVQQLSSETPMPCGLRQHSKQSQTFAVQGSAIRSGLGTESS